MYLRSTYPVILKHPLAMLFSGSFLIPGRNILPDRALSHFSRDSNDLLIFESKVSTPSLKAYSSSSWNCSSPIAFRTYCVKPSLSIREPTAPPRVACWDQLQLWLGVASRVTCCMRNFLQLKWIDMRDLVGNEIYGSSTGIA
jgi:hypothetical protein